MGRRMAGSVVYLVTGGGGCDDDCDNGEGVMVSYLVGWGKNDGEDG